MDRRSFLIKAGAGCLCAACGGLAVGSASASEHAPHWSYEGAGGPQDWGKLAPEYSVCTLGKGQSPVDLTKAESEPRFHPHVEWKPFPLVVQNNGHTIQIDGREGGSIVVDGRRYALVQFHFHHPSEHTIEAKAFEMECHFVHKAVEGDGLAVLGVMIVKGAQNPNLEEVFSRMPSTEGEKAAGVTFDPAKLLPGDLTLYRYEGSLTTPPCSEIVRWAVLKTPITASAEQIARFAALFPHNARPVQPLNGRKLLIEAS